MDKLLKVIVALSAIDKMSSVIKQATTNSISDIDKLKKSSADAFGKGSSMLAAGAAITASLAPAVSAFSQLEDANTELKAAMMDSNGNVGKDFEAMTKLAEQLGDKLPGTTADFDHMFEVLKNNGIESATILNGVGKSAAYLAVAIKKPYEDAAKFAAKMKEATGVADSEMMGFLDTIARIKNVGVDTDEMQYAFGRSAGALKLMGLQGLEASKGVAAVYAQLVRAGMSGETVGTGFSTVLNSLLDPKKYTAFKQAAAGLGVDMVMFEKGKFLGMENFIKQLDKLKQFSAGQRAGIVNALTGGGQDAAMLQTLINNGVGGLNRMNEQLRNQADLNTKVEARLKTLNLIWEATTGTIENMFAALGSGFAPELKKVADLFGRLAGMTKTFLSTNPEFAKFIGLTIAGMGALLSIAGVINLVRGAFLMLNVVMAANPFILVAMIAIAAIALVYAYWGKIAPWFKRLWESVKKAFFAAIEGIKFALLNFTPVGLIFQHWEKITGFFGNLFERVKGIFVGLFNWTMGLGTRFFNAGANIVKSIWNGIKSLAHKPIEAIRDITKKMRDYLPFSPAKEGALRDLHKVKIVETIAQAIKPMPIVKAIQSVTNQAGAKFGISGTSAPKPVFAGGGGSGGITVNFHPTINGGGDPQSVMAEIRKFMPTLVREIDKERERKERKKY